MTNLRHAYTSGGASNILSWRSFAAFLNPSLFSSQVLRNLVDDNVTPELLQAVAREHAKGRRLLVATTDLDSEQTVIWDMGLLASQATRMRASCSRRCWSPRPAFRASSPPF